MLGTRKAKSLEIIGKTFVDKTSSRIRLLEEIQYSLFKPHSSTCRENRRVVVLNGDSSPMIDASNRATTQLAANSLGNNTPIVRGKAQIMMSHNPSHASSGTCPRGFQDFRQFPLATASREQKSGGGIGAQIDKLNGNKKSRCRLQVREYDALFGDLILGGVVFTTREHLDLDLAE